MPTETIGTVNNRNIVGMLKGSLENGSITQDDYDELMQLFFPGPKLVQGDLFDEKAEGGMANINEMTRPLGYAHGGIAGYEGGGSTELQERIDKLIIDIQVENMSPDPNYKRIDGLNNQLKYFTSLLKD